MSPPSDHIRRVTCYGLEGSMEISRTSSVSSTIVNSYCHAWSCAPAYFLRKYRG